MRNRIFLVLTALLLSTPFAFAQSNPIGNPIAVVQSTAMESGHVLKAAPGLLYGLAVTTSGAAGWVEVDNVTAAPSDGAVTPILCYAVPASSTFNLPLQYPVPFSTGITAMFSSAGCVTQTKVSEAFFQAQVR